MVLLSWRVVQTTETRYSYCNLPSLDGPGCRWAVGQDLIPLAWLGIRRYLTLYTFVALCHKYLYYITGRIIVPAIDAGLHITPVDEVRR